jgi:hypothetical protein
MWLDFPYAKSYAVSSRLASHWTHNVLTAGWRLGIPVRGEVPVIVDSLIGDRNKWA